MYVSMYIPNKKNKKKKKFFSQTHSHIKLYSFENTPHEGKNKLIFPFREKCFFLKFHLKYVSQQVNQNTRFFRGTHIFKERHILIFSTFNEDVDFEQIKVLHV